MSLADLIAACAETGEVPATTPDATGHYEFTFDGNLAVRVSTQDWTDGSDAPAVMFRGSVLDTLPAGKTELAELLGRLLRWTFPRLGFQQEVLALEPGSGELVLWCSVLTRNLDPARFAAHLERFLNSLEFWAGAARRDGARESLRREEIAGLPSRYSMLFP